MYGKRKHALAFGTALAAHTIQKAWRSYKRRKTTHKKKKASPDGGAGSTGDMNKVIWRRPKGAKRKYKRFRRFKKKVERAIESDMPLTKVVMDQTLQLTNTTNTMKQNVIGFCDEPDLRLTMSTIDQVAQSSGNFSERYHLMDWHCDGFYTNSGNTLAILDFFWVVPRTDNVYQPSDDFYQAATAGGEATATLVETIGMNPFMFSMYCSKWLIISNRRVMIQPGETKEFRYHKYINKTIQGSRFQQGGTTYKGMKGLTSYVHIFGRGQPVHDSTTNTLIGSAPFRVDFYFSKTYTARGIASPASLNESGKIRTYLATALPSVAGPRTVEEFNPSVVTTATAN